MCVYVCVCVYDSGEDEDLYDGKRMKTHLTLKKGMCVWVTVCVCVFMCVSVCVHDSVEDEDLYDGKRMKTLLTLKKGKCKNELSAIF